MPDNDDEEDTEEQILAMMERREWMLAALAESLGVEDVEGYELFNLAQRGMLDEEDLQRYGYAGGAVHGPAIAGGSEPTELLQVPDIRQPDDYGCGACAAMAVGKYYCVGPDDLKDWYRALGTNVKTSTNPKVIANFMRACGLQVEERYDMSIEDLYDCWCAGRPVICPIQEYGIPSKMASFGYGHFVVVIGVTVGKVMVQDPSFDNVLEDQEADASPGEMMIDCDKFLECWHDCDADGEEYKQYGIICGPPLH